MVSPGVFIPLAETTELIHPLTHWVLSKSIAQWRNWTDSGLEISIAVNISARNLLDDRLPQTISDLLEQYDMGAEYLELELTESAFMSEPQRALTNIERIHAMGVSLSIDDFGTGYSSLSYLKRLPVDTLKIDLGFVRHMLESEQDATIVRTIIHLAHDLGLRVVAEGVESQEIFEALAKEDCDLAQGYHISRPVMAGDISDWLMRHARRLPDLANRA
jgi:EAL domain-containing protein (putative c-di-GMP-specific phosphodiesterase class I)